MTPPQWGHDSHSPRNTLLQEPRPPRQAIHGASAAPGVPPRPRPPAPIGFRTGRLGGARGPEQATPRIGARTRLSVSPHRKFKGQRRRQSKQSPLCPTPNCGKRRPARKFVSRRPRSGPRQAPSDRRTCPLTGVIVDPNRIGARGQAQTAPRPVAKRRPPRSAGPALSPRRSPRACSSWALRPGSGRTRAHAPGGGAARAGRLREPAEESGEASGGAAGACTRRGRGRANLELERKSPQRPCRSFRWFLRRGSWDAASGSAAGSTLPGRGPCAQRPQAVSLSSPLPKFLFKTRR